MVQRTSSEPAAPAPHPQPSGETVHLMFVKTPDLTPRGRIWLERAQLGAFEGIELQRLIRLEKLSLG
jgi:hypothetical protein